MPTRKQKKQLRKLSVIIILSVVLTVIIIMFYQWVTFKKIEFVRYPEFGIEMPENFAIHGIDVSKYQENVAWEEVKTMQVKNIKMGFAFIKATEGIKNEDPQYKRNWKKIKQAGMHRGAYHFFIASKDGMQQANNFINTVKLETGDLPPVLDVEQLFGTSPQRLKTEMKAWIQLIENHYHVKPIIYTNVDFYQRYLGNEFDSFPLWIAHYYQQQQPRISREWTFWQHSDQGRINGIVSKVDFNVFNGDSSTFQKLLIR